MEWEWAERLWRQIIIMERLKVDYMAKIKMEITVIFSRPYFQSEGAVDFGSI